MSDTLGFRLLAITPPAGPVGVRIVEAWEPGRDVGLAVLLREPGTRPAALLSETHRLAPLRRACTRAGVPWLLSLDIAMVDELAQMHATRPPGLIGVQLRGDPSAGALDAVRRQLPGDRLGRSCHGTPAPMGARVDYSVLAPIFTPRTASPQPGPGKQAVGLEPLRAFVRKERRVFALGGITAQQATQCVDAGAYGLAGIRTFFGPVASVADNVARLARIVARPDDDAAPPT